MSRSLVVRLALLQQAIALAVIVAFAGSSLWLMQRALLREEDRLLAETAHRIVGNFALEFEEEKDVALAVAATLAEESHGSARVDVYDASGRRLGSTDSTRAPLAALPLPGRIVETEGRRRLAMPAAGGIRVVVTASPHPRRTGMATLTRALLAAALPLLLFSLIASRRIAARALRPIAVMETRAREASVEAGVRSLGGPTGVVEVDRLSESFDRLLARLDDLLRSERRFAADASHELRTPLGVISGEIELALADRALAPATRASLDRAARQVASMRELVEALLLLRRAGAEERSRSAEFEPVNLADVAAESLTAARARHPERAADLALVAPDEVMVSGHAALLAAALGNLVENAVKFTRAGRPIRIAVEASGAQALVRVDDGGEGVPALERERIFDAFYRGAETRGRDPGFGLGLPLLRQVARAHGGDVSVGDSDLGGARFELSLPGWRPSRTPS